MTTKIKLSFLLSVATIGFGGASIQATDTPHSPKTAQRAEHVECFTLITNEENIASYERCLKSKGISEDEATELRKDMYHGLKESAKDTFKKYFPGDKDK
jgi:hypothetical protein